MKEIRVSESFFSIQGEGITVGVPAVFLRLQGCNLDCGSKGGNWVCDTEAVWKKGRKHTINDYFEDFINQYHEAFNIGAHLILTGGEPLLQQEAICEFIAQFKEKPIIEVETNGTKLPIHSLQNMVDQWNVSPKLSNSGESYEKRMNKDALEWFSQQKNTIFKFVVANKNDILEIEKEFPWLKNQSIRQKFLMPAADNRDDLHHHYESVIELAKSNGYSLSQRFHLTVWDQKTGI